MASIFSRIVAGEIPCYKIAETDSCMAFLDVFPLVEGHVLVIPKQEVDYYFDLDIALISEINALAKKVSSAQVKAIPCKRIGVAIIGLEVPHAHMHLVPLNRVGDIDFTKPKIQVSSERMEEIAASIRSFL
jgi:histidine triad (HIT) family protein